MAAYQSYNHNHLPPPVTFPNTNYTYSMPPPVYPTAYTTPTPPNPSKSPDSDDSGQKGRSTSANSEGLIGKWAKEGPVKNACLTCRNKKAKCDGALPSCGACSKKEASCVYVKSRRGGARKRRGEVTAPSALQEFLKRLDSLLGLPEYNLSPGTVELNDDTTDVVRQFSSRDEIFRCYYNEVHPFLAVMPPRRFLNDILPTLLPDSPFLLATQTILVLVPHANDPNCKSANSKRLRSAASHALGAKTMQAIERILANQQQSIECCQALCMLAVWEWGNTGNLHANRARSGQAAQVAMEMGLHEIDKHSPKGRAMEGEDWRVDMSRRTWWVIYANQLTSALVSGTAPVVGCDDPRIQVDFPVCSLSDHTWPNWVNAIRACSRIFGAVNTLYYGHQVELASWGARPEDMSEDEKLAMKRKLVEADYQVMEMIKQAEATAVIELVPGGEEEVVRNQQLAARLGLAVVHIHIHRCQAFPEVSLFSKRICGLPAAPDFSGSNGQMTDGIVTPPNPGSYMLDRGSGSKIQYTDDDFDVAEDMWQPDTYPEDLPAPWFVHTNGAAALYRPVDHQPVHYPPMTASIQPVDTPPSGRRGSSISANSAKPHKAWGVDDKDKAVAPLEPTNRPNIFPPGISLARCATAAHTIVRLEVLHRSAVIALWDGPPKWMPFCACGLVTGAYAFLLLALAVQAENTFGENLDSRQDEVDALLNNVKVIVAGLEAYGVMWDGINVMAGEVKAALEAAQRLPFEIRNQLEAITPPISTVYPTQNGSGSSIDIPNSYAMESGYNSYSMDGGSSGCNQS